MRFVFLLCTFFYCCLSPAQSTVTVCQVCVHRDITMFCKDGNEGAIGIKINDSCTVYHIPLTEPGKVYIVDDDTKKVQVLWTDPRLSHSRHVILDHCTGQIIKKDTLPIDMDDAPDRQIEDDYIAGKISTEDSFIYNSNLYEEKYINAHPDSFLAVYYLKSLIMHLDSARAVKYRNMVSKNNSQYSAMKTIDSYIENYKYKSVPRLGDPFFEFQAKQTDGRVFDSKAISGKVIVLFFWYSGCSPCHKAIAPLREVYDKYRSNGLELISFSFDSKEDEWVKATSANKLPGINVSDLVGFSSPQFLHYAVSAFPFFVVFDKKKQISMVTFGSDEVPLIESKIKELLDIK